MRTRCAIGPRNPTNPRKLLLGARLATPRGMSRNQPTDDLDRLVAAETWHPSVSHRRRFFLGFVGLVLFAVIGLGVCRRFSHRHNAVDPTNHVVPLSPP